MTNWHQITPSIYHRLRFGCAYGLTDVGSVRKSNEDNFLIDPEIGLVAVADGMGGHDGGEIASHTVLSALRAALAGAIGDQAPGMRQAGLPHDPDATLQDRHMRAVLMVHEAVRFANAQVYGINVRNGNTDGGGMGTTLTGFLHSADREPLIIFHVGDSRLYRLRGAELSILTRDQTLYQQALEDGMSDNLPARNLLLQAIGPGPAVIADVSLCAPEPGDLFMLCSDGLYGNAPHAAIADLMAVADAQSLDVCCSSLIELAKAHGSRDNITVLLALCQR